MISLEWYLKISAVNFIKFANQNGYSISATEMGSNQQPRRIVIHLGHFHLWHGIVEGLLRGAVISGANSPISQLCRLSP